MANDENLIEHRFKPGVSGNPGGKTSAQRKIEIQNAEMASRVRQKLLIVMEYWVDGHVTLSEEEPGLALLTNPNGLLSNLSPDMLRLIKDSEERGLGKPVQPFEVAPPKTDEEINERIHDLLEKLGAPQETVAALETLLNG